MYYIAVLLGPWQATSEIFEKVVNKTMFHYNVLYCRSVRREHELTYPSKSLQGGACCNDYTLHQAYHFDKFIVYYLSMFSTLTCSCNK